MGFAFAYDLYWYSDLLHTIIETIHIETFRNGVYVRARFAKRCEKCGSEFQETVKECNVCRTDKYLREPNYEEKPVLEKWIKRVNWNDMTLLELLKQNDIDINLIDNTYLACLKDYKIDAEGKIVGYEPIEFIRAAPERMELIMDRNGRYGKADDGRAILACVQHRDKYVLVRPEEVTTARCNLCNLQMLPVYFRARKQTFGAQGGGGRFDAIYYFAGEILHVKKSTQNIGYGVPKVWSCVDDKTEILTDSGWKLFSDLDKTEKVLTMNPDSMVMEYQKPIAYQEFDYDGRLYKVDKNGVSLRVTPEHNLFVTTDSSGSRNLKYMQTLFIEAEKAEGKKLFYVKSARNSMNDVSTFMIPKHIETKRGMFDSGSNRWERDWKRKDSEIVRPEISIDMDNWLRFLGIYLTEGCTGKGGVHIAQIEHIKEVDEIIGSLGMKYCYRDIVFHVWNVQLEKWFKGNVAKGARNKRIPRQFLNLSERQSRVLLESMLLGDGTALGLYTTMSKGLADDFQELALRCGYSADIRVEEGAYKVQVRGRNGRNTSLTIVNKYRKDDGWEEYVGKVYDVTVEKYHTLYVRRDGKAYWTGNCWMKLLTLMKQDEFLMRYYDLQRPPKGLLIMQGNRDSLDRAWRRLEEEAKQNPYMIYPLIVEGKSLMGSKLVEFIDFNIKPDETSFTEYREEARRTVGALWGVMPLWSGLPAGEGLSNEGLQVVVTNRTVKNEQQIFNEKIIAWIVEQLGVRDWEIRLKESEGQDMVAQIQRERMRIINAISMRTLGYDVRAVKGADGLEFLYLEPEGGKLPEKYEVEGSGWKRLMSPRDMQSFEGNPMQGSLDSSAPKYEGQPEMPREPKSQQAMPSGSSYRPVENPSFSGTKVAGLEEEKKKGTDEEKEKKRE